VCLQGPLGSGLLRIRGGSVYSVDARAPVAAKLACGVVASVPCFAVLDGPCLAVVAAVVYCSCASQVWGGHIESGAGTSMELRQVDSHVTGVTGTCPLTLAFVCPALHCSGLYWGRVQPELWQTESAGMVYIASLIVCLIRQYVVRHRLSHPESIWTATACNVAQWPSPTRTCEKLLLNCNRRSAAQVSRLL
jgi:uncharacterized oligopeptide transporter (OPT) family protein